MPSKYQLLISRKVKSNIDALGLTCMGTESGVYNCQPFKRWLFRRGADLQKLLGNCSNYRKATAKIQEYNGYNTLVISFSEVTLCLT